MGANYSKLDDAISTAAYDDQELKGMLHDIIHGKKVDKTLTVHVELGKTSLNFWSRS
jgi:hypothetical protein